MPYVEACARLTVASYRLGIRLRCDATDRPNRASSPTLRKEEVQAFYRESADRRGRDIENFCAKFSERERLEYAELFAAQLLQADYDQHSRQIMEMRQQSNIEAFQDRVGHWSVENFVRQEYSSA